MLIFLVGFMGCGKSYLCRQAAPATAMACVDMDHAIQDKTGLSVAEIFAQKGEAHFRKEEQAFLLSLGHSQDIIIATGGGAPCFEDNMDIMNQKGVTIFLDRPKKDTLERLSKGRQKRPLLADKTDIEISAYYDAKMKEREPFYSRSLIRITDQPIDDVIMIIRALKL